MTIKKHKTLKLITIFAAAIILTISCVKQNEKAAPIKQSNLLHEDNVNGRIPPPDNVIESTNFFYNEDGRIYKATVYKDTTENSQLLKEINLTYFSNYINVHSYLDTLGEEDYNIGFNEKKQITSILSSDSSGLLISYLDNRVSDIKVVPGPYEYFNFLYDNNDNLLQYCLKANDSIVFKTILDYNNDPISPEFDSRFFSKEIKFIYIGGLNLVTKMGLNFGKSTKNKLIRRTDVNLMNNQIYEEYHFGYTQKSNGTIIKRNIMFSTDTLYYQFKY